MVNQNKQLRRRKRSAVRHWVIGMSAAVALAALAIGVWLVFVKDDGTQPKTTKREAAQAQPPADPTPAKPELVDLQPVIAKLKKDGFVVAAIEQTEDAHLLHKYHPPHKIALLVGREVEGVEPEILQACDTILEIPMFGKKESYNVVQAAAMALYHCRFTE